MSTSWKAGDSGVIDGIPWRIRRGNQHPDDLILDWRIGGEWRAVSMEVPLFLADFLCNNEDVLHPPPRQLGGDKLLRACRQAWRAGWEHAWTCVLVEKRLKADQPRLFSDMP